MEYLRRDDCIFRMSRYWSTVSVGTLVGGLLCDERCWFFTCSSFLSELIDPGFMYFGFPTKPLKISSLPINQKATQRTRCVAQSHRDSFNGWL
jgi:hypothetical protein